MDVGKRVVVWFRKSLRIHDNVALAEALKAGKIEAMYCIFVLDPWFIKSGKVGTNRMQFLLESLQDLNQSLTRYHSRLLILQGNPQTLFEHYFAKWKINELYFEWDSECYALERDSKVKQFCQEHGIYCSSPSGHTLYNLQSLLQKSKNGAAPLTYTSFLSLIKQMGEPNKPIDTLQQISTLPQPIKVIEEEKETGKLLYQVPCTLETLLEDGTSSYVTPTKEEHTPFYGGETEALQRMNNFLQHKTIVCQFEKPKTGPCDISPNKNTTTVLSPYLKFGCLSIRTFYFALLNVYNSVGNYSKPPESLLGQLYWREFFYLVAYFYKKDYEAMKTNPVCIQIPWKNSDKDLETQKKDPFFLAWKNGQTGFPWIDAVMHQLRKEGWMHHLARHAVACFLTRGDLYINWECGRDVFDEWLLDADPSLNNGNWLWLSSSCFFYQYFRVYSPISFAKKTDPNGNYIRHYLPVLKHMPKEYIYEPWKAPLAVQKKIGCIIGQDYPKPIVEHEIVMKQNMNLMKQAYEHKTYGTPLQKITSTNNKRLNEEETSGANKKVKR